MERKNIAVILGHTVADYHGDLLHGIIGQAKRLDYNVFVFSLFSLKDEFDPHQIGEENIYRLINFNKIDGIVFVDVSFWAVDMRKRVYDYIKENFKGPIVCANSNDPQECHNVCIDELSTVACTVEHLITCHGKKKIYCLTGFKDNPIAETRLEAYRRAMAKHGLEVKDSYVYYGDFWEAAGQKLANDIADGKVERPEAVVCGNDSMALSLTNMLMDRGIVVPDDIAVTGYDAVLESYENMPSITTYKVSSETLGARCICELHKILTGEDAEQVFTEEGCLVEGESCGCKKSIAAAKYFGQMIRDKRNREELIHSSGMMERLTTADNLDKCLAYISEHIYLLANIKELALCLDENWNTFSENDNEYSSCGYSENVHMRLFLNLPDGSLADERFRSADMLPPCMREDRPICCYFVPLHFADRCFGYIVLKYRSDSDTHDKVLRTWVKNINTAFEYIRVKDRYNVINNRLYIGSLRDALTGIYNRQGYKKFAGEIFNTAREEHKKLLLIVVDLDRLKYINDSFGHTEGDNAITVVAQALQSCSGNSEKCARTGGDEFAIVGCYDYVDETPDYYKRRIEGYLSRYNDMSHKAYAVEASIGCFCGFVDECGSVDECYAVADRLMYANKIERRKNRTD